MTDSPIWVDSDSELEAEEEAEEWQPEEEETAALEEVRNVLPPHDCSATAAAYRSVCTSSSAKLFAKTYKVPPEYGLCAPRAEERSHAPPPGYAAVYTHHFQYGLKLPLQPFVASVLAHYQITLAQLHPNGIFFILGFLEICRKSSVSPTVALFRRFFRFQKSQPTNGWYTFRSNPPKIVHGQSPCVSRWKTSFLYFKTAPMTENLNLSWNYTPTINPSRADNDGPSAQTIDRILSYVKSYSKHKQEVEKMIEADTTMPFAPKSCSSKDGIMKAGGEMQAKKSSMENETCSSAARASIATLNPNTTSTESPSAACRLERLKRKAEFDATEHAKTLRGPTECSQVPSVPGFKDMSLDQIATYNQKCFCSLHSQLQGDRDELQKVVDLLKAEVSRLQGAREDNLKDRENEIASLEGDKDELQKVVDSLKTEVSRLQGAKEADLKNMKSEIASLQRERRNVEKENASLKAEMSKLQSGSDYRGPIMKVVEKVMATMEQEAKDKNEEIGSLKSQLKSVLDAQSQLKSSVDDRGPLLKVYTQKLLETQAFGRLFYDLTTSAQRFGRHEAAEQIQDRFPAIPEDALVGLQDPLAAVHLENLLCDLVHDEAFKFTLLDHLLSLPEIPTSSQLKHLDVDEDHASLIAPPLLQVKLEK